MWLTLWLPVSTHAAAGCALFSDNPALCRLHPECAYTSTGVCVFPQDDCSARLDWTRCTHGVECQWDDYEDVCHATNTSHPWFSVCRARHPSVYSMPFSSIVDCLGVVMNGDTDMIPPPPDPRCQWDSIQGYCTPRYAQMCPSFRSMNYCESTPGCVWRKATQSCYGLSASNEDCGWSDLDPTQCASTPGCVPDNQLFLCHPAPVTTLARDESWRQGCNNAYAMVMGAPCVDDDSECLNICYQLDGCQSNAGSDRMCDVDPHLGGCSNAYSAGACAGHFNGICVWNYTSLQCAHDLNAVHVVRVPSSPVNSNTSMWALAIISGALATFIVVAVGWFCTNRRAQNVAGRVSRLSKVKPAR